MAIVYFLCGLASSGKTTTAKKIEAEQERGSFYARSTDARKVQLHLLQ